VQPGRERQLVTTAILTGMFLSALETTAVAAAMPTAVGDLGGVARYSWVFSAYLLTATTTMPLFGKLADLYGRKRVYQVSVLLFLLGSALCGLAESFGQLVLCRALQGLGAGGLTPTTVTIVGDIYSLEERARIQGIFAGLWAFASLVGPLLGGAVTELLSWRWVFFLSIPFGLASAWMLERFFRESRSRRGGKLDVAGSVCLTAAIALLLVALIEGGESWGFGDPRTLSLLAAAALLFRLFLWQERRAAEPMLPLDLFGNRLIAAASAGNVLLGMVLFAVVAYIPMFAQGVMGGTAVAAGASLTPVLLGWPLSSTVAGRVLMRVGYRRLALAGGLLQLLTVGYLALRLGPDLRAGELAAAMFVLGVALGFSSMPYLLGVQNAVPWHRRGIATSSVPFFRSIGGAVAVAVLGTLLAARLGGTGADPNALLDETLRRALAPAALAGLRRNTSPCPVGALASYSK
jgi:EmrB/QacA subfamily drug resistance transporter